MKRGVKTSVTLSLCALLLCNNVALINANESDGETSQNISIQRTQDGIPIYSSVEEWEASGDTSDVVRIQSKNARYTGGYAEYRYVDTKYSNDTRVGYHPDFKEWKYVDAYYFSSTNKTTFSPSVSLTWGPKLSVGVSVAKSGSSGFIKNANGSRKSRPWVRADITTKRYDMYLYNEFGKLDGIYRLARNISTSSDVQIFVDHLSY